MTPVAIPRPCHLIGAADKSVFLGSCFAEYVGRAFVENGLQAVSNPVGPAYCPASMVRLLDDAECCSLQSALPVAQAPDGRWHTWLTNTRFCRPTPEEARASAAEGLAGLRAALLQCHHLFLTFGTSRAYHLASSGEVVVNCHKHPDRDFTERDWTVEEMTELLDTCLLRLRRENPHLRQVVLTVSPYRYAKYGFHGSQLAKARLLLMADALQRRHPDWVCYFPAYEILLDELRDYRFYAPDQIHPAPQAVQHIWQRLHAHWLA